MCELTLLRPTPFTLTPQVRAWLGMVRWKCLWPYCLSVLSESQRLLLEPHKINVVHAPFLICHLTVMIEVLLPLLRRYLHRVVVLLMNLLVIWGRGAEEDFKVLWMKAWALFCSSIESNSVISNFIITIQESFGAIRTVRSFAQEDYEIARYSEKVDETLNLGLKQAVGFSYELQFCPLFSSSWNLILATIASGRTILWRAECRIYPISNCGGHIWCYPDDQWFWWDDTWCFNIFHSL